MHKEKILVTGTTGFIGSHIVPELLNRDYDVYALERYVTGRYVVGQMRSVKTLFGDLTDSSRIKKIIREVQPSYVIHLAALSAVAYSYEHPQENVETNLIGTINLAEACLQEVPNFKQFLFASTSETYGNGPTPKTETTPQNPNSPYAVSKLACEKYLLYMREAFNFPATILHNFNTYGRKDNTHFVVERTIVQMLQGKVVRLGDPAPIRDFLYVSDHVNSYLTCLGNEKAMGEVFNFCTGRGVSVKELVDIISDIIGFKNGVVWGTIPSRPLDIHVLVGDYSKAKKILGWTPKYTLEEGLKLSIDYWKKKLGSTPNEDKMAQ
jgi:GDP-mannose 4,6-dehydratase